jgi:hypothetical protein
MNRLAQISRCATKRSTKWTPRSPLTPLSFNTVTRSQSTVGTFSEREKHEESRYFKREEERLKAEARAKFEALLAKGDDDADRQQLLDQLAAKDTKTDVGFLEKHNLNNKWFWVPVSILVGAPMLINDVSIGC